MKIENLNNINNNPISREWKNLYEKQSVEIKKALDDLKKMKPNEYQFETIKRSKIYPQIGDVFAFQPKPGLFYCGTVVNNHIQNKNGNELIVVFLFDKHFNSIELITADGGDDDLGIMVGPLIVTSQYWKSGLFYNVGKKDVIKYDYGFYHILGEFWSDEYGTKLHSEPKYKAMFGLYTIFGVSREVNKWLIIHQLEKTGDGSVC